MLDNTLLTHPTLDHLHALGLAGMAKAFTEIEAAGSTTNLGHAEWLGLLIDRELSLRRDKRFVMRLRAAKLVSRLASRMSTIAPRAALTARCCRSLRRASGSKNTPIF